MNLEKDPRKMSDAEYNEYIERELEEADKEANDPNTVWYSHEEFKQIMRRVLDGKE